MENNVCATHRRVIAENYGYFHPNAISATYSRKPITLSLDTLWFSNVCMRHTEYKMCDGIRPTITYGLKIYDEKLKINFTEE